MPKANAPFYNNLKKECDKQTICRDAIHRVFTLPKDVLQSLIELVLISWRLEAVATQTKPACAG
ncbi:hypothetical protein [Nostoc sp.]|uniref:hypothetical protein n=1 Tax=Nostoc sp. TaxID=1180 RepID=UPI002FF7A6F3